MADTVRSIGLKLPGDDYCGHGSGRSRLECLLGKRIMLSRSELRPQNMARVRARANCRAR